MKRDSKYIKSKTSQFIIFCISIGLIGIIIYFAWPFLSVFSNPEELKRLIIAAGAWGPLIYILKQITQVLLAPIPGQVIGLIGGYLFGPRNYLYNYRSRNRFYDYFYTNTQIRTSFC